ncbi:MAG: hypothetical protein Q9182_004058 [Xanthomendoza sp. 2 TL-2023]
MHQGSASTTLLDQEPALPTASAPLALDLTTFPSIYVLHTHVPLAELHGIEQQLTTSGALLTYDIREAKLILGYISKPRRAKFELQAGNVQFRELQSSDLAQLAPESHTHPKQETRDSPPPKRPRLEESTSQSTTDESTASKQEDSSTVGSDTEGEKYVAADSISQLSTSQPPTPRAIDSSASPEMASLSENQTDFAPRIKVINIQWLKDSVRVGEPQDLQTYLVYEAELLPSDPNSPTPDRSLAAPIQVEASHKADEPPCRNLSASGAILERAKADAPSKGKPRVYYSKASKRERISDAARRDFSNRSFTSSTCQNPPTQRRHLLHQTTSEYEEGVTGTLPLMPDWVIQKKLYSCERATPLNSLNDTFIAQLKEIKVARLLTNDEIGVRAYSTSIASLAAYPYEIHSTTEILALPGCDQKIAHLFHEWQTSPEHCIRAVKDIQNDHALKVLRLFYEIWGVGATTAREFYYDKKWQDLDDIVEFGWGSLSRVQQIGIKYYDDFLLKIPRTEVKAIADIVTRHAQKAVDERVQCIIVGGYRRGKSGSGDVDLILSHPEQSATAGLVDKVVRSLEQEGWITHTLTLNLTNTKRGQETLPYITNTRGAGFDTLDKALVVWQDQVYDGKGSVDAQGKPIKNPHPHRRVDIIVSPWRTVGCAVAGWTSGTTFQRDLRRYAKRVKGWKFDSSGVRERGSGNWIDLEGWADPSTRCKDPYKAERRVFEGLGLEYREPWDRCTG